MFQFEARFFLALMTAVLEATTAAVAVAWKQSAAETATVAQSILLKKAVATNMRIKHQLIRTPSRQMGGFLACNELHSALSYLCMAKTQFSRSSEHLDKSTHIQLIPFFIYSSKNATPYFQRIIAQ